MMYRDNSGETYDEQFLWDIFIEKVDDGEYPDYSDECFEAYLKSEGIERI